ncbi:hypothetical protein L6164_018525 [Bauhinia variegata]|uniref:Uncharacterized protein n=1 Tax=Bauhinia variegata TaxID=167791 RepID=A0ACB9NC78_BAUVA|nr:hypothetical protein L6164_018525 [Bauhinia variegata]
MQHNQHPSSLDSDPKLPTIKIHHPASPRTHSSSPRHHSGVAATPTPTAGARRKIGVAVDLSDESAYAVRWSVQHYIRPGDAVILLHVSPTSVLFGADWGSIDLSINTDPNSEDDAVNNVNNNEHSKRKLEVDFDAFTASKAADLAKPLRDAQIPYKIHIVKDHDMKERLCLEVERLGLSAVIMGSRGFGAVRRGNDGKLGSVSDYCVHHCVCPVVVVRYPDDKDGGIGGRDGTAVVAVKEEEGDKAVIKPVHLEQVHKKGGKAYASYLDVDFGFDPDWVFPEALLGGLAGAESCPDPLSTGLKHVIGYKLTFCALDCRMYLIQQGLTDTRWGQIFLVECRVLSISLRHYVFTTFLAYESWKHYKWFCMA